MANKNRWILYEIDTPVWLTRLSAQYGHTVTLADVPDEVLQELTGYGVNIVWLMGVWERSPRAIEIGNVDEGLQTLLHDALPDYQPEDFIGSAYAVRDYRVNGAFGGEEALAKLRERLQYFGMGLMLDFVPNHTAPDHPWVTEHPSYYVQGTDQDLQREPENFMACEGRVLAKGRDPQWPAWGDVVQLNAFAPDYRQAAVQTLQRIVEQCDAVRCDMAMLLMNDIFAETWGARAGAVPKHDFWQEVIEAVCAAAPTFTFVAEAYWSTEQALLAQGFDYVYDKTLYDLLVEDGAMAAKKYVRATKRYRQHMVHFIENHDEPRAAATFDLERHKAAAKLLARLPGMWLVYDGQLEGATVQLPVHLGRAPEEPVNATIHDFYMELLHKR